MALGKNCDKIVAFFGFVFPGRNPYIFGRAGMGGFGGKASDERSDKGKKSDRKE